MPQSELSNDYLGPIDSGRFIADKSEHVKIDDRGIDKAADLIIEAARDGRLRASEWVKAELHPKGDKNHAVQWCFIVDTLNFSFWPSRSGEHFQVTLDIGESYTGYFALCACVNRALDKGIPLLDAQYCETLSLEQITQIFTGDNEMVMPLIEERWKVLRETAHVLVKKFNGSFFNCLHKANRSAQTLLRLVVENFDSYRDFGVYHGKSVSFLKRAQILVADLNSCLSESPDHPYFTDIDSLSMFADYRVPQSLYYLGVFTYSQELIDRLHRLDGTYEKVGEGNVTKDMEIEIRGCSIRACELIVQCVKSKLIDAKDLILKHQINSAAVDYFLWRYRRQHAADVENTVPFHRMRSTFY